MRAMSLVLLGCTALAHAQEAVTIAEMSSTLIKTEGIFRTVLKLPAKTTLASSNKATATRAQIVDGFFALFTVAKPKFTMSLPAVPYDPKRLSADIKGEARQRLERLIREGFIAPYGPLATSKGSGLTISEYGDALGQVIARTMERTHLPSTAWSPYLQGPNGPPPPKKKGS